MIDLSTRNGFLANVPETQAEDSTSRFSISQAEEAAASFAENGYVVVTGLIPNSVTSEARSLWSNEVKPFTGKLYRQATARLERHCMDKRGRVMNPILNLQSLDPRGFPGMRAHARKILALSPLATMFHRLLGDRPKFVQSMYFEGNTATWEHRDSPYLDSEQIGGMVGAWIALEDIAPRAGRLFVVPGSHRIGANPSEGEQVAKAHDSYVCSVVDELRVSAPVIAAPALREGDVLFWSSLTIHGSLDSHDAERSRSSITCHAIPASHRFMQYHKRVMDVPTDTEGDVLIYAPKDLARMRNRLLRAIESWAPAPFYTIKKAAITLRMA